jgi:hypothetical protein
LHDPFASLLMSRWDEGECKKTKAAFVRLIASLMLTVTVLVKRLPASDHKEQMKAAMLRWVQGL